MSDWSSDVCLPIFGGDLLPAAIFTNGSTPGVTYETAGTVFGPGIDGGGAPDAVVLLVCSEDLSKWDPGRLLF